MVRAIFHVLFVIEGQNVFGRDRCRMIWEYFQDPEIGGCEQVLTKPDRSRDQERSILDVASLLAVDASLVRM
jgi:hypothetical protein